MNEWETKWANKTDNAVRILREQGNEVFYTKTLVGIVNHISFNGITFCINGANNIAFTYNNIHQTRVCYQCGNSILRRYYTGDFIKCSTIYNVSFRCKAIIGKKNIMCKRSRDSMGGNFCGQHKKSWYKKLGKHFPLDVCKLICNKI